MNKKIGLLTFHNAHNYGAVLQCYSTLRFLISNNFQVETINYRNAVLSKRYAKKNFLFFLNPKNIYRILKYNTPVLFNSTFERFQKEHLHLSEKLNEITFNNISEMYDSILVGSDQVWNLACNGNDLNYFLTFSNPSVKKIALSASCGGRVDLIIKNKRAIEAIKQFSCISIRESDDCALLNRCLCNFNLVTMVDPVFLLDKDEWSVISDSSVSKKYNNYVFVYMISEDKELIKLAKKTHPTKTIVYLNMGLINFPGVKNIRNVSPEQFLGLIKNADFVYTNSFHGLCFSIIFNKLFGIKLLNKNTSINNRIKNLLDVTGNNNYIIEDGLILSNKSLYKKMKQSIIMMKNYILNAVSKGVRENE